MGSELRCINNLDFHSVDQIGQYIDYLKRTDEAMVHVRVNGKSADRLVKNTLNPNLYIVEDRTGEMIPVLIDGDDVKVRGSKTARNVRDCILLFIEKFEEKMDMRRMDYYADNWTTVSFKIDTDAIYASEEEVVKVLDDDYGKGEGLAVQYRVGSGTRWLVGGHIRF